MATKPNLNDIGNNPTYDKEIIAVDHNENYSDILDYVEEVGDEIIAHINSLGAHLDEAIVNTSTVSGSKVKDALSTLKTSIADHIGSSVAHTSDAITNVSTIAGAKVSDALETLDGDIATVENNIDNHKASSSAHSSNSLTNSSSVSGSKVSDALDTLDSDIVAHEGSSTAHASEDITVNSTNPSITADNVLTALEDLQAEIGLIIASSGTSDTEVVNARLSSIYGSFTVLKDRLDNSDVLLKWVTESEFSDLPMTESVQAISDTQVESTASVEFEGLSVVNQAPTIEGSLLAVTDGINQYYLIDDGTLGSITGRKTFPQKAGDDIFIYISFKATSTALVDAFVLNLGSGSFTSVLPSGDTLEAYISATTNGVQDGFIRLRAGTTGDLVLDRAFYINKSTLGIESFTESQMLDLARSGYFEGIKDYDEIITSNNKNIYNGNLTYDVNISGVDGELFASIGSAVTDFIPVESLEDYVLGLSGRRHAVYDGAKNFIDFDVSAQTFNTLSTGRFVRFQVVYGSDINVQMEKGIVPTDYIKAHPVLIRATGGGVPAIGDTLSLKNVENGYVLQSVDINALVTTPINTNYVRIDKNINGILYNDGVSTPTKMDAMLFPNFISGEFTDNISDIGIIFNLSSTFYGLVVDKSTYASTAEAKTGLAGTILNYQLATPIKRTDSLVLPIYPNGQVSMAYLPLSFWLRQKADNKSGQGDALVKAVGDAQNQITGIVDGDLEVGKLVEQSRARAIGNAQSILQNSWTTVELDAIRWDNNDMVDLVNELMTARETKMFSMKGDISFVSNATGTRDIRFLLNDATVIFEDSKNALTGKPTPIHAYQEWELSDGDEIKLQVRQSSAGALSFAIESGSPEFAMKAEV